MFKKTINKENTDNKPVAVVLGGTVPHKDLILTLGKRGYYTVLVDYFQNPPAAKFSDIHYQETAMDYEVVLAIAKEVNASLVISTNLDQQMHIAMKVSESLGLPHPISPEKAIEVTNKKYMKKIMSENGIPTARYYSIDKDSDLNVIDLTYPVIVKPVDNSGSAGVTKVESPDRLREVVEESFKMSRSGNLVVEEFIEGQEMNIHGYAVNGEYHLLFGTCRISAVKGNLSLLQCNMYAMKLKESLQKKIVDIINRIIKCFDLPSNTPVLTQVMIRGEEVFVIEFSPRQGGGLSSYIARECAGFDFIDYSVDYYIGNKREGKEGLLKKYVICYSINCVEGIFDKVSGADELVNEGIAKDYFLLKLPGDHIDQVKPSNSLVLKYVIEGDTPMECFDRMQLANERTDILDTDGKSIRDHSFILTREMFMDSLSRVVDL